MKKSHAEQPWLFYGLVTAVMPMLYLLGIKGTYYGDDVLFIFPRGNSLFYWFTHANPRNVRVYRPLEAVWLSFSQNIAGLSGVPVHTLNFLIHLTMALIIVHFLRRHVNSIAAGIAGILFTVSQVNVLAVMGIDTISQSLNALFLLLTYLFFWRFCGVLFNENRCRMFGYYTAITICFLGALFSKESGVSAILGVTVIGSGMALKRHDRFRSLVRIAVWIVPLAVLTLMYLHMRSTVVQVPIQFGTSNYAFKLGMNIPRNLAQVVGSILLPISTVIVYRAVQAHDFPLLMSIGMVTVLLAGLVCTGLILSLREKRTRDTLLIFAVLAILGVFPFILTNHVSELYAYNAMPYAAAIYGISFSRLIATVRRRMLRLPIIIFLVLLFTSHFFSTASKIDMMAKNGESAANLTRQVNNYIETLPSGSQVHLLVEPSFDEYSVFRMTGFKVVEYGLMPLPDIKIRDDIVVTIGDTVPDVSPDTTILQVLHVVDGTVMPVE